MTCVMETISQAVVVHADIARQLSRSKRRCNYHEVKNALKGIVPDDLKPFSFMLQDLRELSDILKTMCLGAGERLILDFPEYKVILDPDGKPLRLERRDRSIAEQIVEESMLIANETVASYLRDSGNPSVYRIHEIPEPERLEMMRTVLSSFDLPVPDADEVKPADSSSSSKIKAEPMKRSYRRLHCVPCSRPATRQSMPVISAWLRNAILISPLPSAGIPI